MKPISWPLLIFAVSKLKVKEALIILFILIGKRTRLAFLQTYIAHN